MQETDESGLLAVRVSMPGPPDTPYAGGVFLVNCQLPVDYPLDSPSVAFLTKVWHPNIEHASGAVCANVLNQAWVASLTLRHLFDVYLPQLLAYPNPDDPFNLDAASEMKRDPKAYEEHVLRYVREYACPP